MSCARSSLRRGAVLAALLLAALLLAAPALAARFHVHVGGTRTAGASLPGDWSEANCYGTLAGALAAAAPADSVLLYPEAHALAQPATLRAFLGNRDLTTDPGATGVAFGADGALAVDAQVARTELRGVAFLGLLQPRTAAALTIPGGAGSVVLDGCLFSGFLVDRDGQVGGAALRAYGPGGGAEIQLSGGSFLGNRTDGPGGAIWLGGGYVFGAAGTLFQDNASVGAAGRGGTLACDAHDTWSVLTLSDCLIAGSRSEGPGGALYTDGATVALERSEIRDSISGHQSAANWTSGAGLLVGRSAGHVEPVSFTATDCIFRENRGELTAGTGAGDGGGALIKGSPGYPITVAISGCLFEDNYNAQGAGLYVGRFATGTVVRCRFLDNASWYQGGGAMKGGALPETQGEHVFFDYCEFRGNQAGYRPDGGETGEYSRGGGLLVRFFPRATLRHCTFADNRVNTFGYAVGDGFGHAQEGGTWAPDNLCALINCAFWGENGNDVQIRSEGGGLSEVTHLAYAPGQFSAPGVVPDGTVDLLAFPFTAPDDLRPSETSPLVDAAVALGLTPDLAGVPVPQGDAADIGCYEWQDPTSVSEATPGRDPVLTAYPNPFNPRTNLTALVGVAGPAEVTVYDLRGHEVCVLHRGPLAAGMHTWLWDGHDADGGAMPTGLYVARLRTADGIWTRKLTLVR